jgi:Protein of unknown function (DUF5674)
LIIHVLYEPATREQVLAMLQANRFYIKTVVDIRLEVLAGGGAMHSDCETVLLERDSQQKDVWGASLVMQKSPRSISHCGFRPISRN